MFENIEDYCVTNPTMLALEASNEFYFARAQSALNEWLNMTLSSEQQEAIVTLGSDYEAFKEIGESSAIYPIRELLFEIVSYCDTNANRKAHYNQYEDHRTLAKAGVRMAPWIKSLVDYKFNRQNASDSPKNAFDYLVNPQDNCTVLSENHRKNIVVYYLRKEYTPRTFTDDLRQIFSNHNLPTLLNSDNQTHYLSRLIYHYEEEWKPRANITFRQLVDQLRVRFQRDNIELNILEWKPRQKFVWIADKYDIIGGYTAHYEISSRIHGGRKIYVDVHFEGKTKFEQEIFHKSIDTLPENVEWIKWQKAPSIGYKEVYNLDDEDIVENVTAALEYLEENLGDEIREIINALPLDHPGAVNINQQSTEMKYPLNQILYGPPGTGKTFNSIDKAISIVNPLFDLKQNRSEVKKEFDRLRSSGNIVFTTFHQNMSYEDFIEGIKPETTEDKNVIYEVKDGIFKILCETASNSANSKTVRSKKTLISPKDFEQSNFFKLSLGEAKNPNDREIYEYCIENGVIAIGYGGLVDFSGQNTQQINQTWKALHPDDTTTPSYVNYFINKVHIGDYVIISNGNFKLRAIGRVTGNYYFLEDSPIRYHHFREIDWLFTDKEINVADVYGSQFSQSTIYSLKKNVLKHSFFTEKINDESQSDPAPEKFVIIIDEINRGNVSKIFGELITLIEESKRVGQTEALTAILPYSKTEFSVPSNVYIIGTMNTADRSVEALDTALRRRFDFEEMPPNPNLEIDGFRYDAFAGITPSQILTTINNRIEVLIDKDHLIGHSFFIKKDEETGADKVYDAFYRNIVPLLQEYFYGDYSKIGLVLGSGFVTVEKPKEKIFADSNLFEGQNFSDKTIYRINDFKNDKNEIDFGAFETAIRYMIGSPLNVPTTSDIVTNEAIDPIHQN